MFKRLFIAAALVIISPAIVSAQDIFWSFDSDSNVATTNGQVGTSGTAYIFSDQPFGFDALDLNFTSSDSSVLLLTGGTGINGVLLGNPIGFTEPVFNSIALTVDETGAAGNLFAVNVIGNGIIPLAAPFYTEFSAGAGSGSGAIRLAEVTYDIVGAGTATLDFSLGPFGALQLPSDIFDPSSPNTILNPSFETATLSTGIPEPSSLALLVLGWGGIVVRRKRA